jgi:hypothetical protein
MGTFGKRLTVFAVALLTSVTAQAESLAIRGGVTSVKLSKELIGALTSLKVAPSVLAPSSINPQLIVRFPISTGVLEKGGRGEVDHTGGLQLKAGGTTVSLSSFIIDTTASTPQLTGLVVANGQLVGRAPLFSISVATGGGISVGKRLATGRGIKLALTAEAAQALNVAFSVSAFSAGIPIGNASFRAVSTPR